MTPSSTILAIAPIGSEIEFASIRDHVAPTHVKVVEIPRSAYQTRIDRKQVWPSAANESDGILIVQTQQSLPAKHFKGAMPWRTFIDRRTITISCTLNFRQCVRAVLLSDAKIAPLLIEAIKEVRQVTQGARGIPAAVAARLASLRVLEDEGPMTAQQLALKVTDRIADQLRSSCRPKLNSPEALVLDANDSRQTRHLRLTFANNVQGPILEQLVSEEAVMVQPGPSVIQKVDGKNIVKCGDSCSDHFTRKFDFLEARPGKVLLYDEVPSWIIDDLCDGRGSERRTWNCEALEMTDS